MAGKRDCDCEDFKENMPKINAGAVMQWVHGGGGYDGKKILYCPWCGKKLPDLPEKEANDGEN